MKDGVEMPQKNSNGHKTQKQVVTLTGRVTQQHPCNGYSHPAFGSVAQEREHSC